MRGGARRRCSGYGSTAVRVEAFRKSVEGESRYVWRGLASELRERESCKVISVRSLGGRHGFSELCVLVLNFANSPQTSDQLWFELAERRTGASQGQKSNVLGSKTAQNIFQNGAKSATTHSAKLRSLAPTREVSNYISHRPLKEFTLRNELKLL